MGESEDLELQRLMRRKMIQLMKKVEERRKIEERRKEMERKMDEIMRVVMLPDAYEYFSELKRNKPNVARRIENIIMDALRMGSLVTKLSQVDVKILERKIEGYEPKITIKRRGEKEEKSLEEMFKGKN
ncbi:MAG: DNA-binding protein [Candidatus Baldrarchaeia archaeon]